MDGGVGQQVLVSPVSRRDEIQALAKARIARHGYTGTSMRDIAEATGLLAGSLYSHFRSKAELVRAIVVRFYDEMIPRQRAALEVGGTGAERFRTMLDEVFAICATHRDELTILHYDWQVLSSLPELEDVRVMSREVLDLWRAVVEAGKADGSIDATLDTDAVVRIVTSSVHGLLDTVRYTDMPAPDDGGARFAPTLERVLLGGLTGAGPPLSP